MRFRLFGGSVFILGVVLCLTLAAPSFSAEANSALRALNKSRDSIRIEQIRRHAEVLADDTMEGREAGKAGGRSASTYVMRTLREAGLKPAGIGGTYFQPFRNGCRNILAVVPSNQQRLAESTRADRVSGTATSRVSDTSGVSGIGGEVVILCAHYDHVGYGSKKTSNGPIGSIHNGADDNASGVATVLEVAEALQHYDGPLRRSVLIIFWDAEEKGLWGSKHWLKHPTCDLNNVRTMINVDMVGRLRDKLSLYGTRSMPSMRRAWSRANIAGDLTLDFPWEILDNSDHYPFLKRGIPITMVHTGLHDDYHTPGDDSHRLNYDGIHQTTELVLNFVVAMANRESFPDFRWQSVRENEDNRRAYERKSQYARRKLGVTLGRDGDRLRIDSVIVGSLGQRQGLKPGQIIVSVDGNPVSTVTELRRSITNADESITLQVESPSKRTGEQLRNGVAEVQDIRIPFASKRPRIGVMWRTNEAEPGSIAISGVVPESLAAAAGLKRLDRIHKLGGHSIKDSEHFRALSAAAKGKTELLVERDGRLRMLTLDLPR